MLNEDEIYGLIKKGGGRKWEGDGQPGLVTPVGDRLGAETDDIARSTRHGMMGRFDLGGYDLHRPDTVAHLGAGLAEDLCALLRTLPRGGDNFYRVFRCFCDFD